MEQTSSGGTIDGIERQNSVFLSLQQRQMQKQRNWVFRKPKTSITLLYVCDKVIKYGREIIWQAQVLVVVVLGYAWCGAIFQLNFSRTDPRFMFLSSILCRSITDFGLIFFLLYSKMWHVTINRIKKPCLNEVILDSMYCTRGERILFFGPNTNTNNIWNQILDRTRIRIIFVISEWANTNTNNIRARIFGRIRIRIIFGFRIVPEYEYE